MKSIGEIAHHTLGKMLDKAKNRGELRPYLRNLNVRWFGFDLSDVYEMRFEDAEIERYSVRRGDLVVCEGGYPGRAAIWQSDETIQIQKALHRVRFHEPEHAKWCLYYIHYQDLVGGLSKHFSGTGIQHFTGESLSKFLVPLPPLQEQRRIVAVLDEAFNYAAKIEQNCEKNLQSMSDLESAGYRAITESYDAAGWQALTVKELAADHKGAIRTGPFGSQLLHGEFVDEGVAVLGIDNAVSNEFRWGRKRFITEEKYKQLARYRVMPGDVLITIMGTCGRCAVVPDDIPVAINTKHLCCITLDKGKCLPEFLHRYFLTDHRARQYLQEQAKGSIMDGLNMGIISDLPVLLPPLQIQAEIVARFNAVRNECSRFQSIQQRKIRALEEFRSTLLSHAFSGRLTTDLVNELIAEAA